MITFCKRNYGLMFVLVFLWGFQSVFFPLHHYHLETVHAQSGDLSHHQHQGHLHSHGIKAFNHAEGEEDHRSHSAEDHGSENYQIDLHKSSLKPESPFKVVKNGVIHRSFISAEPMLFSFVFTDDLLKESSGPLDSPMERSPPSFPV